MRLPIGNLRNSILLRLMGREDAGPGANSSTPNCLAVGHRRSPRAGAPLSSRDDGCAVSWFCSTSPQNRLQGDLIMNAAPQPVSPGVAGRGRSEGDRVEVVADRERQRVIIQSPRGISEVILERLTGTWPAAVLVELRLKGLESLTVSGGEWTVQAAVPAGNDRGGIRQWVPPDEQVVLTANDPLWLDLKLLPEQDNETVGGFEWTIPWGLRQANPRQIRVNFIDFYRS